MFLLIDEIYKDENKARLYNDILLTLSDREKLKNAIFEIPIIPRTLNISITREPQM